MALTRHASLPYKAHSNHEHQSKNRATLERVKILGFSGQRGLQSIIHSYTRDPNGMNIENLTEEEIKDIILKKQLEWIKLCQDDFLVFVEAMWEDFICRKDPKNKGHHQIIAEAFHQIADGDAKRLIINMPPRHTKSEFASYLFPAWYIGKYPKKKIMQVSHNAELASRFGSKVRNLMNY